MATQSIQHEDGDIDLVAMWLKYDRTRLVAGAMGGLTAGLVALAFAMILASIGGYEFWMPAKFPALPFLGNEATAFGFNIKALAVGVFVHELLAMILGMVYAHFTVTNSLLPLLGAGFVWGTFSWIFIFCLYVQSFREISAMQLSRGAALFVMLVYGFSLVSVGTFDKMLRKK